MSSCLGCGWNGEHRRWGVESRDIEERSRFFKGCFIGGGGVVHVKRWNISLSITASRYFFSTLPSYLSAISSLQFISSLAQRIIFYH